MDDRLAGQARTIAKDGGGTFIKHRSLMQFWKISRLFSVRFARIALRLFPTDENAAICPLMPLPCASLSQRRL